MTTFKRADRIAEVIQRKLSYLIQHEINDPRLPKFITISAVKVSPDLSFAKIYFTFLEDNKDQITITKILHTAARFLRGKLANNLKLRKVPMLHFVYDSSIEYGKRLSHLIDEANPPDESSL